MSVGCRESIQAHIEENEMGVKQTQQLPLSSSSKVLHMVEEAIGGILRVEMGVEQTQ